MEQPHDITFGLDLPVFGDAATPETIIRAAETAELNGFDTLWVGDHITFPDHIPDAFPSGGSPRHSWGRQNQPTIFSVSLAS